LELCQKSAKTSATVSLLHPSFLKGNDVRGGRSPTECRYGATATPSRARIRQKLSRKHQIAVLNCYSLVMTFTTPYNKSLLISGGKYGYK